MLKISNEENKNYLAKVVEVKVLKAIEGADRIQIAVIDFQDVIVSKQVAIGDIMVYFPVECAINLDFLKTTNVFRDPLLNEDQVTKGFFDDKGRVKAIKMVKGTVKSMGYLVPSMIVSAWANYNITKDDIGTQFDTVGRHLLVEKYQIPVKESRDKQGKAPKLNRLIDGQVRLHADTEQLQRNAHKIGPEDIISISYKTHGTSWWTANVLVKKTLSWIERTLKKLGVNIVDSEYDLIYGSRKVVKNKSFEDPKGQDHFYGYDLWEDIKNHVGDVIPKGWTLYGEMLGYDRNGGMIQKGYDYGCTPSGIAFAKDGEIIQSKIEVYRITQTNVDGDVTELSFPEIKEFCDRVGLNTPYLYFYGKAKNWLNLEGSYTLKEWQEAFITELKAAYNEKPCFMCVNEVPEEGVVVRKETLFSYEAYKLKSFNFLEWESKQLDSGEVDMESEN